MRMTSLTGRFPFVVRAYERACSAFLHGAVLGGLMGASMLAGDWYAAGRLAHLHANVLGWGGLTLLATLVFFGPTVMRARMEPTAADDGANGLRWAAAGLSVAVLALLLTGLGGAAVLPARLVAATGLAVYAAGATAVCLPVVRTGQRATPTSTSRMLQAACCWFVTVAVADAVVVATGQLHLLDAIGTVMLVGVLVQSILAALGYLAPMAWVSGSHSRATALARLAMAPWARPLALNVGVVVVAAAAAVGPAGGTAGSVAIRAGWALVAVAVTAHLVLVTTTITRARLARASAEP
jgi:nitrite reductase (NO-forming)